MTLSLYHYRSALPTCPPRQKNTYFFPLLLQVCIAYLPNQSIQYLLLPFIITGVHCPVLYGELPTHAVQYLSLPLLLQVCIAHLPMPTSTKLTSPLYRYNGALPTCPCQPVQYLPLPFTVTMVHCPPAHVNQYNTYLSPFPLQVCVAHLPAPGDAASHYKAVCRALVTEALELISFLDKISKEKEVSCAIAYHT